MLSKISNPRVAIYNLFWNTRGGGERHSGFLAQVLEQQGFEVDLLSGSHFDKYELGKGLGVDLSRCNVRVIPQLNDQIATNVSHEYEFFVNATHLSRAIPFSKYSAYLTYFPTPRQSTWSWQRKLLSFALAPFLGIFKGAAIYWLTGPVAGNGLLQNMVPFEKTSSWLIREGSTKKYLWLNILPTSDARISVTFRHHERHHSVSFPAPANGAQKKIPIPFNGVNLVEIAIDSKPHLHSNGRYEAAKLMAWISSTSDPRKFSRLRCGFFRFRRDLDFFRKNDNYALSQYQLLLANSEFTQNQIEKFWGLASELLPPPIATQDFTSQTKRPKTIVSVGRFISPGHAHSKRQDVMIDTFKAGLKSGELDGFKLYLLGGADKTAKEYLRKLKNSARGYPIVILDNASREELHEVLETSEIFWCATGYGESLSRRPWVFEHFGITTVEAMAAGAIPVAINAAGQQEIINSALVGRKWNSQREWIRQTAEIAALGAELEKMRVAAECRAEDYSEKAFALRVTEIFNKLQSTV